MANELHKQYTNGDRNFSNRDFSRENLSFHFLSEANFDSANFDSANLSGATLKGCNFTNADLSFANLSNADLQEADLTGTNLEGAILTSANLTNARYNNATRLPQGINLEQLGALNLDKIEEVEPEITSPDPVESESLPVATTLPDPISQETTIQKIPEAASPSPIPPTSPPSPIPKTTTYQIPAVPLSYPPEPQTIQSPTPTSAPPPSITYIPQAPTPQVLQSYNYTTPPTTVEEHQQKKQGKTGTVILSALVTLFLGYCVSQSFNGDSSSNSFSTANYFESVSFPLAACGDPMPTNPRDYPVNLYPVFIDYSSYNFQQVTQSYCADAYRNTRANGTRAIQVASFTSRDRAQEFANFMRDRIGSGDVGYPNTFYE